MATNEMVLNKLRDLYFNLFNHDGYSEMRIEIKILKRGQKEVIIHCGKQYRYVVNYPGKSLNVNNAVYKKGVEM